MERFLIFSEIIFDYRDNIEDCGKIVLVNPRNIAFIDEHERNKNVMVIHFTQEQSISVWKKEVENYREDGRI